MRPSLIAAVMLLGACHSEPPANPITLEPMQYDALTLKQSAIAGTLDLVRPPQGGFVSFVGWSAQAISEETVLLKGRILDPSGAKIAEDARTVALVRDGDSWVPDLRSYLNVSNITLCPFAGPDDRQEKMFKLEIELYEPSSRRSGMGTRDITLTCTHISDATMRKQCACECAGNFVLGKCT